MIPFYEKAEGPYVFEDEVYEIKMGEFFFKTGGKHTSQSRMVTINFIFNDLNEREFVMTPIDLVTKPDQRINDMLTEIEKLEPRQFENHTFVGHDVYLDGRSFNDCKFQNCRIFIKLGSYELKGDIQFEDCTFDINGPASNVESILYMLAEQDHDVDFHRAT